MDQVNQVRVLPDIYINTGKASLLGVIKLVEALLAGFALYSMVSGSYAVQKTVTAFFDGLFFAADSQSPFYSVYQILQKAIQVVIEFELVLIILDGFGVIFTRIAHRGSGLVKLVHLIRYLFSIIGLIASFVVIGLYYKAMISAAKNTTSMNYRDAFTLLGSYEYVLFFIVVLGAFWILITYDRHVARVMKQVSKEIKAEEIQPFSKTNRLGREAFWLFGILAVSIILSVVELVAGNNVIVRVVGFLTPTRIMREDYRLPYLGIVAITAFKFLLVNRCSADFDKAHR